MPSLSDQLHISAPVQGTAAQLLSSEWGCDTRQGRRCVGKNCESAAALDLSYGTFKLRISGGLSSLTPFNPKMMAYPSHNFLECKKETCKTRRWRKVVDKPLCRIIWPVWVIVCYFTSLRNFCGLLTLGLSYMLSYSLRVQQHLVALVTRLY